MPDPYNSICDKAEEAWNAYLAANRGTLLQYTSAAGVATNIPLLNALGDDESVSLPYILIAAGEAVERIMDSGNFDVPMSFTVFSDAAKTTRAEHKRRAGALGDMIYGDDLHLYLLTAPNAPGDFSVDLWKRLTPIRRGVDNDLGALFTEFTGTLWCRPS